MSNPEANFKDVANQFVPFYYKLFDENRVNLSGLYRNHSMLSFEGDQIVGGAAIIEKLQNLPFQQVVHRTDTLDAQPSADDGIMVLVTGALQVDGQEKPMSFTQTFQLKKEGDAQYYVLNDFFRIVYPAA